MRMPKASRRPRPASLFGVLGGLATVIVGGAFATVAIIRRDERSVFVLATLGVWELALFLVVGELAFPH
jgi:cell division protein FtsN